MSKLYHREVFWPALVEQRVREVAEEADFHLCRYGFHAKRAAQDDRYGEIRLPLHLQINEQEVFEAEIDQDNSLRKFLVRTTLDQNRDMVLVFIPGGDGALFCKTVWINLKSDKHRTLKRQRYVKR